MRRAVMRENGRGAELVMKESDRNVAPETSSGLIVRCLEEDIVSGRLAPGQKLDEKTISERFELSRTPVREAFRSLAARGLVQMFPNKGAVVASLALTELIEMFQVMAELEGMCARLAARRMTVEEIKALSKIHEESHHYVTSAAHDAYYEINASFHEAIYHGSHNSYLEKTTLALTRRLKPFRRIQLQRTHRLCESHREHGAILSAIRDGNDTLAETLMRDHVEVQGQALNDMIATAKVVSVASR